MWVQRLNIGIVGDTTAVFSVQPAGGWPAHRLCVCSTLVGVIGDTTDVFSLQGGGLHINCVYVCVCVQHLSWCRW